MKFGAKLVDSANITHFTHIIASLSRLCAKTTSDKSCVVKLLPDSMFFILPEFSSNNIGSGGTGRCSFWMQLDPNSIFEFYISEGKSEEENFILLEIQPESLLRTLKASTNLKMVRIKLTKRQSPCLTIELDLHSISSKVNSRCITHDIPIKVISTAKLSADDFQEPNASRTTLSIQMPPLKLLKHMIERMKCLSEFVYLEATNKGTLTFKIETDAVSVCSYFRNLNNIPISEFTKNQNQTGNRTNVTSTNINQDDYNQCSVRLSLKRLNDFVNALQYQPSKIVCNFVNQKYAHFFVIHDDDLVLQYLISAVLS